MRFANDTHEFEAVFLGGEIGDEEWLVRGPGRAPRLVPQGHLFEWGIPLPERRVSGQRRARRMNGRRRADMPGNVIEDAADARLARAYGESHALVQRQAERRHGERRA